MLCWCQSIQRLLVSFPVTKQNVQTVIHLNSKSISLHTIALTREAKLWGDTRDCQGKKLVKCRIKYRPPIRHQRRWEWRNFTVTWPNSVELTTRRLKLWYLKRRPQCIMLLARSYRTLEFQELKPFPCDGLIINAVKIVIKMTSNNVRAVFIWVSKSNWFCVYYATRLVQKTRATFSSNQE